MANQDTTLEAIIRLRNEMSRPLQEVQESLNQVNRITQETSRTIGGLQRIMNKIRPLMLVAKDKASPIVQKVRGILQRVTGRHWETLVRAKDKASRIISKIKDVLKGISSKAWSALVKVKDMATSALSKIKGILVGLAAGVTIGVKAVLDTTEASKEYNRNQAVIAGAAAQGGYNEEDLKAMRRTMYGYTGDDMAATNAVSNLVGLGLNQKEMQNTLDAATAVWTAYGDSIPVEGLTESINETAQVSKVTGNLADALNWAGINEDDFNKQLEARNTVEERAKLINDTLMKAYGESKKVYDENTKAMREYNESQDELAEKKAELGKAVAPLNTMLNNFKTSIINGLLPVIKELAEKVKEAFDKFKESEEAQNALQVFKTIFETVWDGIKAVIDAVSPVIKKIFTWIADHSEEIKSIIEKLGNIWEDVWGIVGPLLEDAWVIIEPILSSMFDAIDTVLGVVETLTGAFKKLGEAFGSGDVQNALNASNSVTTDPTYGAYTQIKDRAMGQRVIPRDNTLINAHQGEMLLPAREARQYRKEQDKPQIVNNFYGMTVTKTQDIDDIASALVRKINQQRIILG